MSWFSSAFTRGKGAISAAVRVIPVVGDAAGRVLENIHTGDEHKDANGNWVSNDTGEIVVKPPSEALQKEIDRVNEFNRDELARLRMAAADSAAHIGAGAALTAAAAIGPAGNVYRRTLDNPYAVIGGGILLLLIVYVVASGRK